LIGARYKGEKPHFEISVKLRIFYTHIDPFEEKKISTLFSDFFSFLAPGLCLLHLVCNDHKSEINHFYSGAFRVEMQRESQKDRTILCKYEPTEPGDYRIEVNLAIS
jgi:hypothetical protein